MKIEVGLITLRAHVNGDSPTNFTSPCASTMLPPLPSVPPHVPRPHWLSGSMHLFASLTPHLQRSDSQSVTRNSNSNICWLGDSLVRTPPVQSSAGAERVQYRTCSKAFLFCTCSETFLGFHERMASLVTCYGVASVDENNDLSIVGGSWEDRRLCGMVLCGILQP